jgi:hypothetical protein
MTSEGVHYFTNYGYLQGAAIITNSTALVSQGMVLAGALISCKLNFPLLGSDADLLNG